MTTRIRIAALALGLALAGCSAAQKLQTVGDAQTAVDKTATAVATIADKKAPLLTKAQDAACAGQALANTLTDMLNSTGHARAARVSEQTSVVLGDGCTWTRLAR